MKRRKPKARRNPAPIVVKAAALDFITQQKPNTATVGDLLHANGRVARIESIDTRTRTIKARPLDGVTPGGVDKAKNSYRAFSGMEPAGVVTMTVEDTPRVGWLLGEMVEVMYDTYRDNKAERYLHKFKKSARPLLAVTADTGQLVVVGGDYEVTDRGITDN